METKFDSYYDKDLPWKITATEFETARTEHRLTDNMLVARLRAIGAENVRIVIPCAQPKDIMLTPIPGMAFVSATDEKVPTECRLTVPKNAPDLHNVFANDSKKHWAHYYKICLTPVGFAGVIDRFYVSDLAGLLKSGYAKLVEA